MRVIDVRRELSRKLLDRDFVTDKTGVKTIEIVGASFEANEPVIFGKVNHEWAAREIQWYESQSLSVHDIPEPIPEIWLKVASDDGMINSNYGWMIYSRENGFQYRNVLKELRDKPDSRRAVMIYTRPSMWSDYDAAGMSDFVCTNAVQYMIRSGRLDAVVQMRSNDLIFGYKGDLHWQRHVLDKLSADLGVPAGKITWQVGSAHVYERHFYMIHHWIMADELSISLAEHRELYPEWEP